MPDADQHTFEALLDEHGATALALLRRLCGRGDEAEDVFQDVAVRVWRHLRSRPRLTHPRAWLMTVVHHAFLDHRARAPRHLALVSEDVADWTGPEADPVTLAEQGERRGQIEQALAGLSEPLRAVLALHYTGGLSLREVATALGISVGTVKSRLNAGLEQMRGRLS